MALPVRCSTPSQDGLAYRHLYSRNAEPLITGAELRELVVGYNVPPCTMRWKFETKFKRKASGNKDVILKHVLETCQKHKLEPVNISSPCDAGPGQYVDVLFANGEDLMKAWNAELTFDFYGTQPGIVGRGSKLGSDMVAFEVKTLPFNTNLTTFVQMLQQDERLRQAGDIIDVWATEKTSTRRFQGVVLVLLQVHSVAGVPSVTARTKIPGYFVIKKVPYLVKYAGRPGWCQSCRRDDEASFHSIHACPNSKCVTCGKTDHSSVNCELKRKGKQHATEEVSIEVQANAQQAFNVRESPKQKSKELDPPTQPIQGQILATQPSKDPAPQEHAAKDAVASEKNAEEVARLERLNQKRKAKLQAFKEKAKAKKAAEKAAKEHRPEPQSSSVQILTEQKLKEPASQAMPTKQVDKGQVLQTQAPQQAAKTQAPKPAGKEQAHKAQGSRSQASAGRQRPENLPKKQLQYIKAMERRLLQLCLEDADADVSKLAQSMGVIALSSDDDSDF